MRRGKEPARCGRLQLRRQRKRPWAKGGGWPLGAGGGQAADSLRRALGRDAPCWRLDCSPARLNTAEDSDFLWLSAAGIVVLCYGSRRKPARGTCEEPPLLGWWPAVHGLLSQRWFTVGDISPLILRDTHKQGESQGGRRGANENPRIMVRSTEAREGGR